MLHPALPMFWICLKINSTLCLRVIVYTTPSHGDRRFMMKEENEWMDYFLKRWGEPIPEKA
jgi:hypothetical protein